jgi:Mg/Co/Ni transporter MgtE
MKVNEAIKKDVIAVKRSVSLRILLDKYKAFHTNPVIPVVDESGKLIGVVNSENLLDLLRPLQTKMFRNIPFIDIDEDTFDLESVPAMGELIIVEDIMETSFVSINENDSLDSAYRVMRTDKRERVPVVSDDGYLVGIVGIFDIIWRMFKAKGIV